MSLVSAALFSVEEAARFSRQSVPKVVLQLTTALFSFRFPRRYRTQFLRYFNLYDKHGERKSRPGTRNTNGGVQHGPLDKIAQSGVPGTRDSKQCTGGCERVSSPPETMMQASVVAGIMACRSVLGLRGQGFEHNELRRATRKSSTRGSVSVKSTHEPVSLPKGQSSNRPERLVTQLSETVFPGRGRHVPAPAGGASGLSFCRVLPPSLLSSFVFRAGFPGVVQKQEVRSSHFAIRGVSRGGLLLQLYSSRISVDQDLSVIVAKTDNDDDVKQRLVPIVFHASVTQQRSSGSKTRISCSHVHERTNSCPPLQTRVREKGSHTN